MAEFQRQSGNNNRPDNRGGRRQEPRPQSEFDEKVIEVNRVTRVVKGGKRMRFRALVVIGDKASRVSFGLGKANDVTAAVTKAVTMAKKDMTTVYLNKGTIPYVITGVHKSAQVLIKPAKPGTGLIAGGAVRIVLELAGVKDAVAKMLGSANKISNVMATIDALRRVTEPQVLLDGRGVTKYVRKDKTEEVAQAEV